MDYWSLHLVDYWDQTTGAINRNVLRLADLDESERLAACGQIREAVRKRSQALTERQLLQAAISMVDDLYKYVNDAVLMDGVLFAYLDAFGRTLTETVIERGYVIHYIVENQFSGADFLMCGPFDLFARVFNAAGFVYVCPHQLAWRLMQADGIPASEYAGAIARYIAEARGLGDRLVRQCHNTGRHYVFLEADYEEGALDVALQDGSRPGVLTILRSDAPLPSSTVSVSFPESKVGG